MSTNARHGYSGTPLAKKLGLKPGMRAYLRHAPAGYIAFLDPPPDVTFRSRGGPADLIQLFCAERAILDRDIDKSLSWVTAGGMLWVSWPKKTSPLFRDLTENHLREVILPKGWVDVKVCAVDENWSGLKFTRRISA